ncbi:hypothetical protein GCM10022243_05120 [Saccharothrix violaceirubra]|uniref:Excreted virulence factor EspC (Type VII ESX diderm) n=1 Tax=Saccharothrix violaceirubra TaxID=413306 RepID=A0A7W7SYX9_9PSEU|nr:hypothetical protein [Saccharothrix violaceirubra]MBB4962922.1 hypothetical protein [Saccharothrix violaceirubra]
MDGRISVDARWLELYAERVDEAAAGLSEARARLRVAPPRSRSFGELGRTVRSSDAYRRAAELLDGQLDRACEVLTSAARGLHAVADHYGSQDDDAVAAIKRAGQGR